MSEQNKAHVRRGIEAIWNQRKLELIDEHYSPDYVAHDAQAPGGKSGRDEYKAFVQRNLAAFPDTHFEIEDQLADGDKVATRWTVTGTHQGELMGIQPTGKRVTVTGIIISRIQNGKTVEAWSNYDLLGMLQQLGVVPSMEPRPAG